MQAEDWIKRLNMQQHPEGGWYHEVYRSQLSISEEQLPDRYQSNRSVATSIYFLLKGNEVSKFHVLQSDELWYFHAGSPVTIHLLDPTLGSYQTVSMGNSGKENEHLQIIIPAGIIFGATVQDATGFSLVGCMVAPGFDFADFRLCSEEELSAKFPKHTTIIKKLT